VRIARDLKKSLLHRATFGSSVRAPRVDFRRETTMTTSMKQRLFNTEHGQRRDESRGFAPYCPRVAAMANIFMRARMT